MVLGKWVLGSAVLLMTGSLLVAADDPAMPTTQPVEKKHTMKKLPEPWSMLKSLTPEETTQIEKIHSDAVAQGDKIKEKETDDINAVLTPDQKTELAAAEAKIKADRKEHLKKKKTATTEPA